MECYNKDNYKAELKGKEEYLMDEKIRMDCSREAKVSGRRRFRVLLVCTLLYVVVLSVSVFMYLPDLFDRNAWSEMGVNIFLWRLTVSLLAWIWSAVLICILVRMHKGRGPFGREISLGMYITGAGLMLVAFLFPFIKGYTIEMGLFIQFGEYFTIDGFPFVIGLLCLILGYVLRIGVGYQKEMEQTI